MKRLLGPVILALLGLLVSVPDALAGETTCGEPGKPGVLTGTVVDNVVVPRGTMCTIGPNAQVKGNVKVYGALDVNAPTTIAGNVDGEPGHRWVRLFDGVKVGGNVQIKGGQAPDEPGGFLTGTQIDGNFQWEENTGFLVASGGKIRGHLKMEKNTGGGDIYGNTIDKHLECKENAPAPTGAGNTVGGRMQDQCDGNGF